MGEEHVDIPKDVPSSEDDNYIVPTRRSVYRKESCGALEDNNPIAPPSADGPGERPPYDVTTGVFEVMFSITEVIRDYLARQLAAEECLDFIKGYLIAMVESWNNNHHAGIISIVNSFDDNAESKYLSLRRPSILDSGVSTSSSTSSLCQASSTIKESPLVTASPSFSPCPNIGQPHKLSLQDSYKTLSEQTHRNSITRLMPLREVDDPSPHTSNHQLTSRRERWINHPMIPHARRSYVQPVLSDPIQRRTPAPFKLASRSDTWPHPMGRQESGTSCDMLFNSQSSITNHVPILPQRSHTVVHRPIYPPPLPQRRHSDLASSSACTTILSRFSPILDDFNEDDKDDIYEDAEHCKSKLLDCITPKQCKQLENDSKIEAIQVHIRGQPNSGKLQKKLWKRANTPRKRKRPSVHKRSLTHSSDASSDDSDTPKYKLKPHRRVSSYHPECKTSVVRQTRRKTADAFLYIDSQVEKANLRSANAGQSSISPDHITPPSEGDNEESEHSSDKHSGQKSSVVSVPIVSPAVKALQSLSIVESDASSDTDQEIFYPYHSTAERVYATADIGLAPKDRYARLMGYCNTKENVMKAGYLLKFSDGKKHWSKYWFKIRGSLLFCYKSKAYNNRRPKMSIKLSRWGKLSYSKEEEYSFEIETHSNKCRLKATSQSDMDDWMAVLQKVLLTAESPYANVRGNSSIKRPKQTICGHVYLIEYQLLCYRWANLDDKSLHFHTSQTNPPYTKVDLDYVSLVRMNKLPRITGGEVSGKVEELTAAEDLLIIQIKHNNTADKYIVFEGVDNQLAWQYHLMQQCRELEVTGFTMTNTEKLIYQLLEGKEPYCSTLWNHPTLMMNPSAITTPLTTLPYASDTEAVVKLNETLLLYCSTNMVSTALLEYHIVSVKDMIQRCLQQPCIQNEFYCQVIRQTQSVTDPDGSSVLKAWQLLSFIIPVFLPKQRFLTYLEEHIARHITISKHFAIVEAAKYCKQLIARTYQNGLRENIPSNFELSTLMSGLMNNSTIAVPLNTTVVFTDPQESEMKIEFDPCTIVHEVLIKVGDEKKCSPDSEFTLSASWCDEMHSDDIPEKFLFPIQKLCDVISQWTDVMVSCPVHLCNKLIQPVFTFKKRLFFKKKKTKLTNKEVTLLSHQFQQDVIKNKFPAERDTYIKLTGLMAQMVCGDYKLHIDKIDTTIKDLLLNYLPYKMTTNYLQHTLDVMSIELKEQWKCLHQYKPLHCAMEHLQIGWKWSHFGSKLFHTQSLHNGAHLWLAVNEDGISELENDSLVTKCFYPYDNILSFGQQENYFKLVVTQSNTLYYAETLLYFMSQLMIEEINGLTASYLEHFLQVESDDEL